jgi:hypothetical protein
MFGWHEYNKRKLREITRKQAEKNLARFNQTNAEHNKQIDRDGTLCEEMARMLGQIPASPDYVIRCSNSGLVKMRAANNSGRYIMQDNNGLSFMGIPIVIDPEAGDNIYAVQKDEE